MALDKIIPDDVKLAAKRGFVRTAFQSLATGFAVPGALTLAFTGDGLLALGLGLAGLAFSAIVNGAQSALDIAAKGIPGEYAPIEEVPAADRGARRAGEPEFDPGEGPAHEHVAGYPEELDTLERRDESSGASAPVE